MATSHFLLATHHSPLTVPRAFSDGIAYIVPNKRNNKVNCGKSEKIHYKTCYDRPSPWKAGIQKFDDPGLKKTIDDIENDEGSHDLKFIFIKDQEQ